MTLFSALRPARPVPVQYRSNFIHLYLDIAWFGLLNGSSMTFMAVFAARQGANPFQIGLLTAGPAMVNLLFAIPAGRWLEKQPLGPAVFWASVLHRFFYVLLIPLPVLFLPHQQVWSLIALTLLMSIPGIALAVGFNALFADVVPPEWRGHVVGRRNALLAVMLIVASLLCGYILDRYPFTAGYQIVFSLGFLGAALSSFHLWFVRPPHDEKPVRTGRSLGDLARPGLMRLIGDSLRHGIGLRYFARTRGRDLLRLEILTGPFGRVVGLLFTFHLFQHLAIPLFPPYWVQELHFSDREISLGSAVFYAHLLFGSALLARLTDGLGNKRVSAIGAILMAAYPGLMALTRGVELFLVTSAVGGLAWALAGGALNNYLLDRVPENDRAAHLVWYNLALNGAVLLGALAGPLWGDMLGLTAAMVVFAVLRLIAGVMIWRWG